MIAITKNTANVVILTLTEKTTYSPVTYIIEFKNDETSVKSYVQLGSNVSTQTQRYDQFTITEKASPNVFNSEIELTKGDYEYSVYETDEDTSAWVNLSSVTSVGNIIEVGKARCYGTPSTNTEYSGATSTNVVYEG